MRLSSSFCLFFFSLFFWLFGWWTFAHPLDISSTNITINGPHINGSLTMHSYQAQWLLQQNGVTFDWVWSYFDYHEILENYITWAVAFTLWSGGDNCPIQTIAVIQKDIPAIIGQGLDFSFFAACPRQIDRLDVSMKLFPSFPLQTNRMTFYAGPWLQTVPHTYKIFTVKNTDALLDFTVAWTSCMDSDGDGLCDEDEVAFDTDPLKWDMDGDCYSDFEELYNSRDPRTRETSPGQVVREWCQTGDILSGAGQRSVWGETSSWSSDISFDAYIQWGGIQFGVGYLTDVLHQLYQYTQDDSLPLWNIILAVILLGFVHAIGPGHAKHLMTSYLIEWKKWHWHGFLFSLFFAITHVSDLFVLFLWVSLVSWLVDPTPYMPYIQFFSIVLLLVYSVWMFVKERKNRSSTLCDDDETIEAKSTIWHTLGVAFVSWLAPCTFGRSIFLLLFTLGRFDLIVPLIAALCFGIYLCLQCIAIFVIESKKTLLHRFHSFAQYSWIVSFGFLVLISLWLLGNLVVSLW